MNRTRAYYHLENILSHCDSVIAAEERAIEKHRHRTDEPLLRDFRNLRKQAEEMISQIALFAPHTRWGT
jgi:hypothetical protein